MAKGVQPPQTEVTDHKTPTTEELLAQASVQPERKKDFITLGREESQRRTVSMLEGKQIPAMAGMQDVEPGEETVPFTHQGKVEEAINEAYQEEVAKRSGETLHARAKDTGFDSAGNTITTPLKPNEALDNWGLEKAQLNEKLDFYKKLHPLIIGGVSGLGAGAVAGWVIGAATFWPAFLVGGSVLGLIAFMRRRYLQGKLDSMSEG